MEVRIVCLDVYSCCYALENEYDSVVGCYVIRENCVGVILYVFVWVDRIFELFGMGSGIAMFVVPLARKVW